MLPLLPTVVRAILSGLLLWACDPLKRTWTSPLLLIVWACGAPVTRFIAQKLLRRWLLDAGSSVYVINDDLQVQVSGNNVTFQNIAIVNLERVVGLAKLFMPFAFQTMHAKSFTFAMTWPVSSWLPWLEIRVSEPNTIELQTYQISPS
jgi:hypothetical protein